MQLSMKVIALVACLQGASAFNGAFVETELVQVPRVHIVHLFQRQDVQKAHVVCSQEKAFCV